MSKTLRDRRLCASEPHHLPLRSLSINSRPNEMDDFALVYGTPSAGKMASLPEMPGMRIVSPLSILHYQFHNGNKEDESSVLEGEKKDDTGPIIGISRPSYGDDSGNFDNGIEPRLGIDQPEYEELAENGIPFSPFGLMNKKEEKRGPRPSPFDFHGGSNDVNGKASSEWPNSRNLVAISPTMDTHISSLSVDTAMVHTPTAEGKFLLSSTAMAISPNASLKFSIEEDGKGGMTPRMIRHANRKAQNEDPTTVLAPSVSNSVLYCAEPFKVFVLLLQPRAKIFELIQLIYAPNDTTVGDIINMIPENATEPALGNQPYSGFCRPNSGEEIIDLDLMASGKSLTGEGCARITCGEILIAMPKNYRGLHLTALAKPILANKQLVLLLERKDPLCSPDRDSFATPRSPSKSSLNGSRHSKSDITTPSIELEIEELIAKGLVIS